MTSWPRHHHHRHHLHHHHRHHWTIVFELRRPLWLCECSSRPTWFPLLAYSNQTFIIHRRFRIRHDLNKILSRKKIDFVPLVFHHPSSSSWLWRRCLHALHASRWQEAMWQDEFEEAQSLISLPCASCLHSKPCPTSFFPPQQPPRHLNFCHLCLFPHILFTSLPLCLISAILQKWFELNIYLLCRSLQKFFVWTQI